MARVGDSVAGVQCRLGKVSGELSRGIGMKGKQSKGWGGCAVGA